MKSTLMLVLGILAAVPAFAGDVNYTNTADLSLYTRQFKLVDANYAIIPTKVEIQRIPGCYEDAESSRECTKVVVLESEPVVQANVSYVDDTFGGNSEGGTNERWLTLNFKLSDFPDDQVDSLKAAYPTLKHPFSKAGRRFAANNLELSVNKESRTIQVVDVKRSKLCPVYEDGTPDPTCKEVIVYKDAEIKVKEVTVNVI